METWSTLTGEGWASFARALAFWAPVCWAVPLFGGRHLPAPARMALALVLAGCLELPLLSPAEGPRLPELEVFLHFGTGLLAALLLRLPFELLRGVGSLAASSRGTPTTWTTLGAGGDRAPSLAVVLELALLATAGEWALDHQVLRSASRIHHGLTIQLGQADLSSLGLWFFASLLALGLPFLLATLGLDLALGVLGRFLPQLPLFFLGQPLKALGIVLLLAHTAGEILPAARAAFELLP